MYRSRHEAEDILLYITPNCETLIKQTQKKPLEILKLKLTQRQPSFSFSPDLNFGSESNWLIGLTSLKEYNSIFIKTQAGTKIELSTDLLYELSFKEIKDEEVIVLSDSSPKQLQPEK